MYVLSNILKRRKKKEHVKKNRWFLRKKKKKEKILDLENDKKIETEFRNIFKSNISAKINTNLNFKNSKNFRSFFRRAYQKYFSYIQMNE